ncbi:MAG: hypothetical protein AB7E36_11710 [Salinivirgaceae bacterium]
MKNLVFILTLFLYISSSAQFQVVGGTYEKLAKLYSQAKYESCLFKADDYTFKSESSKDAEPFLYMSLCFYQLSISEDSDIREDYKDGFKQAVNYAGRFIKKDKEGEMYNDNIDFINHLKEMQKKEIKEVFDKADYRKTVAAAKLFSKLNREEDLSFTYFIGLNEVMSNNVSQGERTMDEAVKQLNEKLAANSFKADPLVKSLVIDAILKYSEFLVNQEQIENAHNQLEFALRLFPNDGYIKLQYNVVKQAYDKLLYD